MQFEQVPDGCSSNKSQLVPAELLPVMAKCTLRVNKSAKSD